jgi:hypothetical protein
MDCIYISECMPADHEADRRINISDYLCKRLLAVGSGYYDETLAFYPSCRDTSRIRNVDQLGPM